jgi:hypothetical protein
MFSVPYLSTINPTGELYPFLPNNQQGSPKARKDHEPFPEDNVQQQLHPNYENWTKLQGYHNPRE